MSTSPVGAGAGRVHQINVSGGGVPKLPVAEAQVGERGLVGDRQADTRYHGRPWQALCLWSLEVIEALREEGHPIEPGFAGENLTLSGLWWPDVVPGVLLAIGDFVLVEVTAYAVPCSKNAAWFAGGDFRRMSQDRHPGESRVYAGVHRGGTIVAADPVALLAGQT